MSERDNTSYKSPVVHNPQNDSKLNCRNTNLNNANKTFGMTLVEANIMDNISYESICSMGNLTLAWRKARKNKTTKLDVIDFEENIERNLIELHNELTNKIYSPRESETFILRDPKTRRISKAHFRDRVVHHALMNIIKPIFEKQFIHDSCANQINKGTSFALKRFDKFKRKVTRNYSRNAFCLKADIRHYFEEVNHEILLNIIKRKIKDEDIIWLIQQILNANFRMKRERERLLCGLIKKECLWETILPSFLPMFISMS